MRLRQLLHLFTDPARGLVEVGCGAHARRHFWNGRENEPARMGAVLAYIAQLRLLREQASRPVLEQLRLCLLKIQRGAAAQERRGSLSPTH